MIINQALFDLEDRSSQLVAAILQSQTFTHYKEKRQTMMESSDAAKSRQDFMRKKERFEELARFGSYAPGFKEEQLALRRLKRKLDLNEAVADFRVYETALQSILDGISQTLAQTISEEIKVDAGNPFFTFGKKHQCGGDCHHGE